MNSIKKILGIVWMILAIATGYYCIDIFGSKLTSGKQEDLVFGIIMFFILMPLIVIGLFTFGYFAVKDEYKD